MCAASCAGTLCPHPLPSPLCSSLPSAHVPDATLIVWGLQTACCCQASPDRPGPEVCSSGLCAWYADSADQHADGCTGPPSPTPQRSCVCRAAERHLVVLDDDEFFGAANGSSGTLGIDAWRAVTAVLTSLVFHSRMRAATTPAGAAAHLIGWPPHEDHCCARVWAWLRMPQNQGELARRAAVHRI